MVATCSIAAGKMRGARARADFAVGDRVQLTATDKKRHIYNGNVGTITGLDAHTGQITATLDAAGGTGRPVSWSAAEFEGFRHGYAGTIYKGQGKTLDRTYLYHTEHWRSSASYVALTRQRESAQVFVARETARDAWQLARQMGRGEVRAASLAWATGEELAPRQDRASEASQSAGRAAERVRPTAAPRCSASRDDPLQAKVRNALERRQRAADEPAYPGETETSREVMRRELLAMDRGALAAATRADRVGDAQLYTERGMPVLDVARLVDPAYAAAAERTTALRKEAAESEKAIQHYTGIQQFNQAEGDTRWRAMGFMRQAMHKSGARRDRHLGVNEGGERMALEQLAELDPRRAALARQIGDAEKAEAAAFTRAEPKAAAELAKQQERGSVAREVLQERRRQEVARERTQRERNRGQDRGLGR